MAEPTTKNNLLLPTNGCMLPPVTVPQKLGTGSATGNPRNKCALKPGHSLMDWVRLGNTGADLSGTRGRVVPVSTEELAKHNTRDDAWIAIRGKVFNVTRYMDFHPGGIDELMRGVGRDATKLFDEVHAWVNYQQLLAKCLIGPLRNVVKVDSDLLTALHTNKEGPPVKPRTPAEVVPRFDWIQTRGDITVYIYTRQFCNPGLIARRKTASELELCVQIDHVTHMYALELQQSVDWPPKAIKVASETGKIEVNLQKTQAELWTSYGAHTTTKLLPNDVDELHYDFEIVAKDAINHDSFGMCLQDTEHTVFILPIGFHVSIATSVNGEMVRRSYTPVDAKYVQKSIQSSAATANTSRNGTSLNFLVKSYSNGLLSAHMRQLKIGDALQVSPPKGSFKLQKLLQHRRIALLAAGSGLTPFLNLIDHLLKRNTNRIEHLKLMDFNKTEADIWCYEDLVEQQTTDERFQFENVLSQPNAEWQGLKGHITKELLTPLADKTSIENATFVAVCGPAAFNQKAEEFLKELGFSADNLHFLQG